MLTRISKEVRLLFPPVSGVVVAWLLAALLLGSRPLFGGQFALGRQIAELTFILGIPLILATSFGAEFQHHTITLLLTQPLSRRRVWLEKWLVAAAAIAFVLVCRWVLIQLTHGWGREVVASVPYVAMFLCSTALWTFVARSTVGGLALAGFAMMALEFAMTYGYYRATGVLPPREAFASVPTFVAIRTVYAIAAFTAGGLLYARFQATPPAGADHALAGDSWAALRPRRAGVVANLVRKELMLQRTTFRVAGGFTVCWLVAAVIVTMMHWRTGVAEVLFPFMLAVYVPLVTVLAGTLANGEERSLGVHAWHLTLPVESKLQWEVKLGMSLGIALVLGLVLPGAIGLATGPFLPNGHVAASLVKWQPFLLITSAVVLMFWASALFGHIVRAVVAMGVMLFIWAVGSTTVVYPLAEFAGRHAWRVITIVRDVRLPRASWEATQYGLVAGFAVVSLVPAVAQSLTAFRRAQLTKGAKLRMAATLLAVAWLALFVILFVASAMSRMLKAV